MAADQQELAEIYARVGFVATLIALAGWTILHFGVGYKFSRMGSFVARVLLHSNHAFQAWGIPVTGAVLVVYYLVPGVLLTIWGILAMTTMEPRVYGVAAALLSGSAVCTIYTLGYWRANQWRGNEQITAAYALAVALFLGTCGVLLLSVDPLALIDVQALWVPLSAVPVVAAIYNNFTTSLGVFARNTPQPASLATLGSSQISPRRSVWLCFMAWLLLLLNAISASLLVSASPERFIGWASLAALLVVDVWVMITHHLRQFTGYLDLTLVVIASRAIIVLCGFHYWFLGHCLVATLLLAHLARAWVTENWPHDAWTASVSLPEFVIRQCELRGLLDTRSDAYLRSIDVSQILRDHEGFVDAHTEQQEQEDYETTSDHEEAALSATSASTTTDATTDATTSSSHSRTSDNGDSSSGTLATRFEEESSHTATVASPKPGAWNTVFGRALRDLRRCLYNPLRSRLSLAIGVCVWLAIEAAVVGERGTDAAKETWDDSQAWWAMGTVLVAGTVFLWTLLYHHTRFFAESTRSGAGIVSSLLLLVAAIASLLGLGLLVSGMTDSATVLVFPLFFIPAAVLVWTALTQWYHARAQMPSWDSWGGVQASMVGSAAVAPLLMVTSAVVIMFSEDSATVEPTTPAMLGWSLAISAIQVFIAALLATTYVANIAFNQAQVQSSRLYIAAIMLVAVIDAIFVGAVASSSATDDTKASVAPVLFVMLAFPCVVAWITAMYGLYLQCGMVFSDRDRSTPPLALVSTVVLAVALVAGGIIMTVVYETIMYAITLCGLAYIVLAVFLVLSFDNAQHATGETRPYFLWLLTAVFVVLMAAAGISVGVDREDRLLGFSVAWGGLWLAVTITAIAHPAGILSSQSRQGLVSQLPVHRLIYRPLSSSDYSDTSDYAQKRTWILVDNAGVLAALISPPMAALWGLTAALEYQNEDLWIGLAVATTGIAVQLWIVLHLNAEPETWTHRAIAVILHSPRLRKRLWNRVLRADQRKHRKISLKSLAALLRQIDDVQNQSNFMRDRRAHVRLSRLDARVASAFTIVTQHAFHMHAQVSQAADQLVDDVWKRHIIHWLRKHHARNIRKGDTLAWDERTWIQIASAIKHAPRQ